MLLVFTSACNSSSKKQSSNPQKLLPSETVLTKDDNTSKSGESVNSNCKLIVNGKEISSKSYVYIDYDKHYAELPLTSIFMELGATVDWVSGSKAIIVYKNNKYVLDTEIPKLYLYKNKNTNYFIPPPGGGHTYVFKFVDREYIISNGTMITVATFLGIEFKVDYNTGVITVEG